MRWLDDEEMSDRVADWLRGGAETQHPEFFMTLARAAMLAEYEVLRPALLEMNNLEMAHRVAAFNHKKVPATECAQIAAI
jgi:hypothetical protein